MAARGVDRNFAALGDVDAELHADFEQNARKSRPMTFGSRSATREATLASAVGEGGTYGCDH